MQFPKLTALQSRLAASLAASAVLVFLYLTLTQPQFAYAVDLDSRIPPDHNHPIIIDFDVQAEADDAIASSANPVLLRRAPDGVTALANNVAGNLDIEPGVTQYWMLPKAVVNGPPGVAGPSLPGDGVHPVSQRQSMAQELRRRQAGNTVYITLSTCVQATPTSADQEGEAAIPPQLELFISESPSNEKPGPGTPDAKRITVSGGYALFELNTTDDVFIGVSAPNTTSFKDIWNYDIAGSIDAPFHSVNKTWPNLFFVDGDNHSALLISNDTTWAEPNSSVYQEWLNMTPPYVMFAHNQMYPSVLGVQYSYCGLRKLAQISAGIDGVEDQNVVGMTTRGVYNKPKEQFYINNLNATSSYWGFLAMQRNSTDLGNGIIGGGGMVWAAVNFSTKTSGSCALVYNLSFCSEVAYAIPSNPDKFPPSTGLQNLASLYDNNAQTLYQNFNYSLQQIPCNTTSSAQYSLARNCDDCVDAYKRWLCAVTIPRCEDFSNPAPWLKPRNAAQPFLNGSVLNPQLPSDQALLNAVATNSSRNPLIDQEIGPGPYKEVLPCIDLCYQLVQSCPAALGFGCPYSGRGLEDSYGVRSSTESNNVTCSYLGAVYELNGADRGLVVTWALLLFALGVSCLNVWL